MAFLSPIQKCDDGDFLKSGAEAALQRIMDYDVENLIGAAPHERTPGGRPTATAIASGRWRPGWEASS